MPHYVMFDEYVDYDCTYYKNRVYRQLSTAISAPTRCKHFSEQQFSVYEILGIVLGIILNNLHNRFELYFSIKLIQCGFSSKFS